MRYGALPSTFRALRHRNFRLFFFGQMVSLIGTWMQTIAQQWLVYRLTGSATMLGTVNLMGILPLLPLSLWGGSLADRFPKRSILVFTQSAMMLQAFTLAALTWTGAVQVWHVLVLAMLLGAVAAVDAPTRQAFIVEMVGDKEDLPNAIALNSAIFNGGRALGPAAAGVVVAIVGEAGAFFLNGASFLAVIASLLMMRLSAAVRPSPESRLGAHLREGMQYVRGHGMVLVLLSLVAVSAFLSMPYSTLLPVFAHDVLAESARPVLGLLCARPNAPFSCRSPEALTYGMLMAATGVGAVTGALFVASLPKRARRGRWLTLSNLCFPSLLVVMALSRSFPISLLILVGVGFTFVTQNALANTLIQISVPDELRGRVMSLYTLMFQGMMRVGGLQAGAVGDLWGAPTAVGVGAAVCLTYNLWVAWRYPHLRRMA